MEISVGHTPDSDDAFMFYGMFTGKVPSPDFDVNHVIEDIEKLNRKKAKLLYDTVDGSKGFYVGTCDKGSRSLMNVTVNLENEDLEKKFVEQSIKAGFTGLKGHRSVGGIRASIYNSCTLESVEALVDFMKDFQSKNS